MKISLFARAASGKAIFLAVVVAVLAIGGLFFRSKDPDGLSSWYRTHLGIGAGCAAADTGPAEEWSWKTQGGPVVFAPFVWDENEKETWFGSFVEPRHVCSCQSFCSLPRTCS